VPEEGFEPSRSVGCPGYALTCIANGVVARVNEAIDETRREFCHMLSKPDRNVIKGSGKVLLCRVT
jgi:hypothetical protein